MFFLLAFVSCSLFTFFLIFFTFFKMTCCMTANDETAIFPDVLEPVELCRVRWDFSWADAFSALICHTFCLMSFHFAPAIVFVCSLKSFCHRCFGVSFPGWPIFTNWMSCETFLTLDFYFCIKRNIRVLARNDHCSVCVSEREVRCIRIAPVY